MVFNSIAFLVFLPIVVLLFYLLPHKWRWLMLLAASCVFYMWFVPKYILILLVTIVIDYAAGIQAVQRGRDAVTEDAGRAVPFIVVHAVLEHHWLGRGEDANAKKHGDTETDKCHP